MGIQEFISLIKYPDEKVNGPACQNAGTYGASSIKPLAELLEDKDFETERRARRALYSIVRHASAPGENKQRKAVETALIDSLKASSSSVQRDILWMLSEVGGTPAIAAISPLLSDNEVREDARCCLLRIPGAKATAALRTAFESAPEDFKSALADSLRARGVVVAGYPSRKFTPDRQTTVSALEKK